MSKPNASKMRNATIEFQVKGTKWKGAWVPELNSGDWTLVRTPMATKRSHSPQVQRKPPKPPSRPRRRGKP